MGKAIGIDLGTTNSCAAIVENGKARVITYKGGSNTIPSVFAISDKGERLVGHDAKRQAQLNPQNTVTSAKRLIGRNFHSKTIEKIRQVFTYELVEGEGNEVLVKVKDQVFTLEQISAAILRKIKDVAEESLSAEVDQAVITVPAYFNDRQRQAVRTAGRLANLKVLRVLNEPTAAALAYGLGKNLNQRIAVYDLGGGTFDISIIDIKGRIFEVIATGGDTFLGGVDFDDRVMTDILEQFYKEHAIDLAFDRIAVQRVRDAAEAAKIELSSATRTRVHIPFITKGEAGPIDIDFELTRDRLEALTADLVDRTIVNAERILRESGSSKAQIDEVLLVGGQSRMPLVQKRVTDFLGKPPCKGVHPDEAVGIGAAIMSHSLAGTTSDDVTLLDVLPMPIGINKVDGTMHVLFAKNQPLPDYKTRTLTTSKDNQRSIMLRIYQGESQICAENEMLGTFVFSGIRSAPKGKVQIEVTFHIDSEGILNLTARDKATGQTVESTLKLGKAGGAESILPAASPTSGPLASPGSGSTSPRKGEGAPAAPPPLALTMPMSGLAQQIGGTAAHETAAHETAAHEPAAHEPRPPPNGGSSESARTLPGSHAIAPVVGGNGHGKAATRSAPSDELQPIPTPRLSDMNAMSGPPKQVDAAVAAAAVPSSDPGLWKKVSGWFKGMFGG